MKNWVLICKINTFQLTLDFASFWKIQKFCRILLQYVLNYGNNCLPLLRQLSFIPAAQQHFSFFQRSWEFVRFLSPCWTDSLFLLGLLLDLRAIPPISSRKVRLLETLPCKAFHFFISDMHFSSVQDWQPSGNNWIREVLSTPWSFPISSSEQKIAVQDCGQSRQCPAPLC